MACKNRFGENSDKILNCPGISGHLVHIAHKNHSQSNKNTKIFKNEFSWESEWSRLGLIQQFGSWWVSRWEESGQTGWCCGTARLFHKQAWTHNWSAVRIHEILSSILKNIVYTEKWYSKFLIANETFTNHVYFVVSSVPAAGLAP